jgi:hypothetical protein
MVRPERREFLAGESPVQVIAGEPGSRPQPRRGDPPGQAGRQEPPWAGARKRAATLVNAIASSHLQPKGVWEGRAAHVTAKATDSMLDPERTLDFPGVWAAARFHRDSRNRRDPTWQPTSGKDRAYKGHPEIARSQEGVRGANSTVEGGDNPSEGRRPASVTPELRVSARAWL